MNRDLIDRAELPTVRIEIPKRLDDETCRIISGLVEAFQTVIKSAPTVDAVEVVRCKDCKMLGPYLRSGKYVYCDRTCMIVREDDYCSYGERKIDAEVHDDA